MALAMHEAKAEVVRLAEPLPGTVSGRGMNTMLPERAAADKELMRFVPNVGSPEKCVPGVSATETRKVGLGAAEFHI